MNMIQTALVCSDMYELYYTVVYSTYRTVTNIRAQYTSNFY